MRERWMTFKAIDAYLQGANFWVWETDADLRVAFLSQNFESLTGLDRTDYLGQTIWDLDKLGAKDSETDMRARMLEAHEPYDSYRWQFLRPNGDTIWLESAGTPIFDDHGEFGGYRGNTREVADEIQQALDMRESARQNRIQHKLLAQIGSISGIGAWTLAPDKSTVEWSDETYDIYEIPRGTEITLERGLSSYCDGARETISQTIADVLRNGGRFDVTLPFKTEKGRRRWVRSMGFIDGAGTPEERVYGTFQDVTEERERQMRVETIAMRDSLTNVNNRHSFNFELDDRLSAAKSNRERVILCFADLDRFKQINDVYGHAVGDEILCHVADYFAACVEPDGFVGRIGGDEFALIFTVADDDCEPVAFVNERVPRFVHTFETSVGPVEARLCMGVASAEGGEDDTVKIMRDADFAMHAAKSGGGGFARAFDTRLADTLHRRVKLVQEFQRGLRDHSVVPFYQPIVSLETGEISGLEALARWHHPARGLIAPHMYMEIFDDNRICLELGELMLNAICQDMKRWSNSGTEFGRVGYNATAVEVKRPGFALNVLATLSKHGLRPDQLVVEVTETTMFADIDMAAHNQLSELREAGVSIALDDFGTGYSSLTHLKDLPFNILKIDKTFVKDVMSSEADKSIIKSLIELGRDLGYITVAEGVEVQAERDFLRDAGCERGQGFFFDRPMSFRDASERLDRVIEVLAQTA
ncbi:MAG: EAL domain-containing protein [Ahrensia sp.]|nr:EAL domain-containing protein [Ahrensia sp.]